MDFGFRSSHVALNSNHPYYQPVADDEDEHYKLDF